MRVLVMIVLACLVGGCSRAYYRNSADKETYHAVEQRDHDPRWDLPRVSIQPAPQSRLYDPYDPDHPPLPPDDPAAHRYMKYADGHRGYPRWHKDGDAPYIEDPEWRNSLPLSEDGVLALTPERAVELGVLNSREYQTQLETLYLLALGLTLNRFEFELHWFGINDTTFTHFGSSADELNTLTTNSLFGFTRAMTWGGQLTVDLMNSFVFQFAGPDHTTVSTNFVVNLIQPLLRNAGRDFRMEALTEAERNVLYQVREFAHFRKQFTFNIATQQYLGLLSQEQQIRNSRASVVSKEQAFRINEALNALGQIPNVNVDQALQSLQQAQAVVINSEASLETALDVYKELLGLPPSIPVRLDDSLLAPFQLTDPGLERLQKEIDAMLAEYRELDQAPPLVKLEDGFKRLKLHRTRTLKYVEDVEGELERWRRQPAEPEESKEQRAQSEDLQSRLVKDLAEIREELDSLGKAIDKAVLALAENKRKEGWEALVPHTREASAAAAQLFVVQTQIRVFLIRLKPMRYELADAVDYAAANRLDLMNQRARVVDAWRQIAVTANQLRAGLDLILNANVATPPGTGNPVDFRASASTYSVGFHFDSPLNRVAERNAYRASQIAYQQARRAFMLLDDNIQAQIRNDLRQLDAARRTFEIQRRSVVTAARQAESAREGLLVAGRMPNPTATLDIINALDSVLSANNQLISAWANYETTRYRLLLDLEALQVDERGLYTDEYNDRPDQPSPSASGNRPPVKQAAQAASGSRPEAN
jgi:outer membrane protein TolC